MPNTAKKQLNTRQIAQAKLAELRALKAEGKTRLKSYKIEEENRLYDLVDEDEYRKIVRKRLDEEDFVVDDHGEGYVDNGIEDWGTNEESSSEEEKANWKKSEKKRVQNEKINHFFKKKAPVPITQTTEEEMDFMANILGKIGEEENDIISKKTDSLTSIPCKRQASPLKKSNILNRLEKVNSLYMKRGMSSPILHPESDNCDISLYSYNDTILSDPPSKTDTPLTANKISCESNTELEEENDIEIKQLVKPNFQQKNISEKSNIFPFIPIKDTATEPISSVASEKIDASLWLDVNKKLNIMNSPEILPYTRKKENYEDFIEDDGSLKMFWIDHTDVNNTLCLFGKAYNKKTQKYVSCFLQIQGIMRNLYFLPRKFKLRDKYSKEEVTMGDVYEEVSELFEKFKINEFKSKPTTRKYVFEFPDVPHQCDYLKVLYPYTEPAIPQDTSGNTFSRVFGTNTSLFEQFVLYKKIMGPCWLHIKEPQFTIGQNFSWCKLELGVINPECIFSTLDSESDRILPPLTLMSISLRKIMNHKEDKQEIVVISTRIYENVSLDDPTPADNLPCQTFTVVRPIKQLFPTGFETLAKKHKGTIRVEKTELSLLNCFLTKIQNVDPDVYIGHELDTVDFGILLSRIKEKKIMNWHRIGRLRRKEWPKISGRSGIFTEKLLASGRLICDLANELGRSLIKAQSWTLSELCRIQLGIERYEIDDENIIFSWTDTAKGMMEYIIHCEVDTYFITAIALKIQILSLTKQLTNLAGNNWARTLTGTRAERNEYILLHEFHREKYICPDKTLTKLKIIDINEEEEELGITVPFKKKDKYKGGLVFEPIKGLYDKYILVMDFNSLYPSIIQEYNICFTTVDRHEYEEDEKIPELPDEQMSQGILPKLIETLVNRRKQIKNLIKDKNATSTQKMQWDIKQQALKLTANSMYGCLGYTKSRFYARPLAVLITYKGREVLRNTKELAESLNLQVVYGDTDSVMINTNVETFEEAIKIGNEFKKHVNERYKLLEIDIDNVYQRMLLHAKKKYAALHLVDVNGKMEPKIDVKGLDMKRREYCVLAKEVSSPNTIRKTNRKLGKNPEEYPNGKSMPHVQVALKKKAKGGIVRVNDVIGYIITGDENDNRHVAERACLPQEVIKSPNIKIDYNYYLANQILPPVERLCGPIEGTDRTRLAECLGLDIRKYQINETNHTEYKISTYESRLTDQERFKDVASFILTCNSCHEKMDFKGLARSKEFVNSEGIFCKCGKMFPIYTISAQLESQIRNHNAIYYNAWLLCNDPSCANRTRQIGVYGKRCSIKNCQGQMYFEYSDKMLYTQLLYYDSLFNVDKAREIANQFPNPESILICAEYNRERFEKLYTTYFRNVDETSFGKNLDLSLQQIITHNPQNTSATVPPSTPPPKPYTHEPEPLFSDDLSNDLTNDLPNDLTSTQIATMTLEETKQNLLNMTKQVALLRRMLRTERSNTAHHTLQHKLLAAELHEAQQTLAAFTHIRHETDRLLFELTIPINTCTTCRRHYQKIQRRLRKILQEWKHDIPTKTLRTQNESQNTLTALNASLNTTDTEAHAINTHKSLSTCHGLMSPISFHPTRRKRRRNVKNDPDTLPNTLKRHLTHHYALRSYQSLPISPNTSPLLRS
ncbi:hypothetical protein PORY_000641 [Pneumocystis oryctolagi]|uniref:Uncharacterized protein n=1 Tax=Pneumocystis oryctolagi TaxID=42067 RepID=A0ACB7CD87_9ASCO|nr:hypothetical protein PORY_000641 [Pneumocystis oryctolagi]